MTAQIEQVKPGWLSSVTSFLYTKIVWVARRFFPLRYLKLSSDLQPALNDQSKSTDFREVYLDELEWIRQRRVSANLFDQSDHPAPIPSTEELEEPSLFEIQKKVLSADICGLAISGGGIRSATFGLGVLQGLAHLGLLSRFDYLSTVSGGGYIGSWLTAWLHREGFEKVESELQPLRLRNPKDSKSVEAAQIRHLRLYSNYLTPNPGLFSFDGWVLIAIYLRNLLLNQLVFLLGILGLFAAVRCVIELFSIVHDVGAQFPRTVFQSVLSLVALAFVFVGGFGLSLFARPNQPFRRDLYCDGLTSEKRYNIPLFWLIGIVPWLVASILSSLIFANVDAQKSLFGNFCFLQDLGLTCISFAVIHGALGYAAFEQRNLASKAGCVSGLIGGAAFFISWSLLLVISGNLTPLYPITVANIVTFGVPLSLTIFVGTNFLMIGGCSSDISEMDREWWSSVNSRLMMMALAWLAVFGTVVFGPWFVGKLWTFWHHQHELAPSIFGVSWLGILSAGLKAAQSSQTGPPNRHSLLDRFVKITPALFLITIVVGLSFVCSWIAYDIYAFSENESDWYFIKRLPYLLVDLNAAKSNIRLAKWIQIPTWCGLLLAASVLYIVTKKLGDAVGVNTFSLNNLYANRLVRCYLGASNPNRKPDPLINMTEKDDLPMSAVFPQLRKGHPEFQLTVSELQALKQNGAEHGDEFRQKKRELKFGPLHIINGALNEKAGGRHEGRTRSNEEANAEGLQFLERQAESFVFTPQYCGSETTSYCSSKAFADDVKFGTAVSVSGAAVSPNMGYHSSPSVTALLTVFNIRLGAWFGNPRHKTRKEANPSSSSSLFLNEMLGRTEADSDYVYVSDGGHFENVGVYELIRRRCRFIVAVDCGADPKIQENIGRLIRQVRIDFGIWIELDPAPITPGDNGRCQSHIIVGRIHYEDAHKPDMTLDSDDPNFKYDGNHGLIVWIKNGLTGDEPGDLINFAAMNSDFPYDTTLNQFFNESLFESYRALGLHSVTKSLPPLDGQSFREWFENVYGLKLEKPPSFVPNYVHENEAYANIHRTLRTEPKFQSLAQEIYGTSSEIAAAQSSFVKSTDEERLAERLVAAEMFSLLENVWLSLNLDAQRKQPIYRGWMNVIHDWCHSRRLNRAWNDDAGNGQGLWREFSPGFCRFVQGINKEMQSGEDNA